MCEVIFHYWEFCNNRKNSLSKSSKIVLGSSTKKCTNLNRIKEIKGERKSETILKFNTETTWMMAKRSV